MFVPNRTSNHVVVQDVRWTHASVLDGDFWFFRFITNSVSHIVILGLGYCIYRYLNSRKYFNGSLRTGRFLYAFYMGNDSPEALLEDASRESNGNGIVTQGTWKPLVTESLWLLMCMGGLLGSYLVWGIMQEKIMTKTYCMTPDPSNPNLGRFKDSQFLVLCNRISAFLLAGVIIKLTDKRKPHKAPLFKYAFASVSNILSSWCQYEALKFISFPTQVLGKVSKVIPVMMMGRLVMKKTYPWNQYFTALLISLGVGLFLFSREHAHSDKKIEERITTASGIILMCGYLLFDSFTSNWQGNLFKTYSMTSFQMMCGVNAFSSIFTFVSELMQWRLGPALHFMYTYPAFIGDLCLISLCSATGQVFIFWTINWFGVVTFTIMMTIRQAASIFLSCLIFGHPLPPSALGGVFVVFGAILLRTYLAQRDRRKG